MRKQLWVDLLLIVILTALAAGIRLYRLDAIPIGLYGDEAANGLDVQDILNGQRPIFFERNNGREPLFIYLQAIAVALLGATPFALRLTSAIVGALTVPAIYWMIREAFADIEPGSRTLAVWTSLFVAFSYWHINFSRLGFRVIMLPLLASITFAWFWHAARQLKTARFLPRNSLVLCGVFLGATLYTYIAARFIPIVLLLVIVAAILLARRQSSLRRPILRAATIIGGTAFVIVLPLVLYFLSHPESFIARSAAISAFSAPEDANSGVALTLARQILKTIGMFGWFADSNLRHNPAGQPALDLPLSIWLFAGVILTVWRRRFLPHLFVVIWLGVLTLPALFSDKAPHFLRMLGVLPAVYLLAVLAMLNAGKYLARYRRWLSVWLPLPFLLFSGITSLSNYFTAWNNSPSLEQAFDVRFVDAALTMARDPQPGSVWIIPLWPVYGMPSRSEVLDFLTRGQATHRTVKVGEDQSPEALRLATQDYRFAHLLRWRNAGLEPDGAYAMVDRKNLLAFLLEKHGRLVAEHHSDNVHYATYELPLVPDYRITNDEFASGVSFGGRLELTTLAYGHTALSCNESSATLDDKRLPSGHNAWVVLRWQAQQPVDNTLKTSLFLTDEAGHLAGQADDPLHSDLYLFKPAWEVSEQGSTYHILPTLPGVPPGRYQLFLAVYDPKTMQRLPVLDAKGIPGANAAFLGYLDITPAITTPQVHPATPVSPGTFLAPNLVFLGYDLAVRAIAPGDQLPLTLYWQTTGKPSADYWIEIALKDGRDQSVAQRKASPVNEQYPTMAWSEAEVLRGWHDLVVPPTSESGLYQLVLSIGTADREISRVSLGNVEISGRPHSFTLPTVRNAAPHKLGNSIAFLGYDLGSDHATPGGVLDVTLYWQAMDRIERSYIVFVHLLGSDGRVWAQQDVPPGQGAFPTSSWVSKEYLNDPYHLVLPPDTPIGQYRIEIGMYDPNTGNRLPILDAQGWPTQEDRILLSPQIDVRSK